MKTSEILNRAADLIEERGWETGASPDPWGAAGGPVCLEGGINIAAGMVGTTGLQLIKTCPAARAVHEYLDLLPNRPLWEWNDQYSPGGEYLRTAEEVIEVLRSAAVIEQAKESEGSREAQALTLGGGATSDATPAKAEASA